MQSFWSMVVLAALAPGLMKGYPTFSAAEQAKMDQAVAWAKAGTSHDKEALALFQPIARKDHRAALFLLGLFYYKGRGGLGRDASKAIDPLSRSAAYGYPGALRLLGSLYYNGEGVKRDLARGYAYLKLAELMHDPMAKNWVRKANDSLTKADLAQAKKQALDWVNGHALKDADEKKALLAKLKAADAFKKIAPDKEIPVKLH